MQNPGMNKLAAPDCPQCAGAGKIRVARTVHIPRSAEREPPLGVERTQGFTWLSCGACEGKGKR